jgi:sRNA-binding protein
MSEHRQGFFTNLPWTSWPAVLPREPGEEVLPLRIGIDEDLRAFLPDTPEAQRLLNTALRRYVTTTRYLEALAAEGTRRHAVDGSAVGLVSEMDRHSAALMLHRRAMLEQIRPKKAGPPKGKAELAKAPGPPEG